ncbi:isoprenylcysteine alpha-carbonyl methylesterase ICME [Quillaja saponaria]|uniref:Isoprenylcysteine alpha-carbonyl methylesterase ICME n=1 Tax=Quillaja saponaria TaxID=32244 RepID=A0AAD7VH92_QUISA|nr:isoprenylcysteine alpha-carbonyl methylesterase ICME [Quillaja saponaria]
MHRFSPEVRILDPCNRDAISLLPHIVLYHGTVDNFIPPNANKGFADALQKVGARTELILYVGQTHTDLFLHDPMRGGKDDLFDHIVAVIHSNDKEALAKDAMAPSRRRLAPEFLLKLAHWANPF